MFVYKACRNSIVTLQLLEDSKTNESRSSVVDPNFAKFRTNKAKVISLVHPLGAQLEKDMSIFEIDFIYQKGEIVEDAIYDENIEEICSTGIHYFKTYDAALGWFYRFHCARVGKYYCWHENGQKEYEKNNKNGELDGKQYCWYENGQKKWERNFKDGEYEGKQYGWHENGQEKWERNFKDDQKEGKQFGWYHNGKKEREDNYKDGQKEGKQFGWYDNGKKEREENYKDGKKEGKQYEWYSNGNKKNEHNYKDGEQDGIQIGWFEDGKIKYKHNYRSGYFLND